MYPSTHLLFSALVHPRQQYIEGENKRLENDELRCFDPREIMVRVEYRFCPNMIVIDTPGLLSAPAKLRHMNEQQRQLQQVRSQQPAGLKEPGPSWACVPLRRG